MAGQFVVHVGAPKTGTTAFQEWAVRNRPALLEAGYIYPTIGATEGGNHAALVSALGGAIEDEARSGHLIRSLEREIRLNPDADVILSAELMTTLRFLPNMGRLHRALGNFGRASTIVLVVRDQISWRNSCYAQAREMLTPLPPFRDYIAIGKHGPRSGNWDFLEQRYRRAGFAFETLPFDRVVRQIGIVAAMTKLPSLSRLAAIADDRREANPSATDTALLVAEQVRSLLAAADGTVPQGIRPKLMPIITRHARRLPGKSFNGFDEELAAATRAAYRPSNQLFAQRHFGRDWDDLFPPAPVADRSADELGLLEQREQRRIHDTVGRVILDAVGAGILQLAPGS